MQPPAATAEKTMVDSFGRRISYVRLSVTDQTGLGVVANGTLSSEAPRLFRSFSTDADGRFTLRDLPFGVYRLVVEHGGFTPYSDVIEVRTAVPRMITVQLSLAAVSSDPRASGAAARDRAGWDSSTRW